MVGSRPACPGWRCLLAAVFVVTAELALYHVGVERHWFAARPPAAEPPRSRYARGLEGANPASAAGALRRAGMVAVGYFARRLEPVCVPDHDRLCLRPFCGFGGLGAGRVAPRNGLSGAVRHRLPGDRPSEEEFARMLRVDHAGEYGATRIYEGQLDVLGRRRAAGVIRQMAEAEKRHLVGSKLCCKKGGCGRHCFTRCGILPDMRSAPRPRCSASRRRWRVRSRSRR